MIKKLRNKFVLVSMAAVTCALAIIVLAINLTNYTEVASSADDLLNILYTNDGCFVTPDRQGAGHKTPDTIYNTETPYESRYFTVKFKDNVILTNLNNIAAISEEDAVAFALSVSESKKTKGYKETYRFLSADGGTFVLFLDCRRQLEIANIFLLSSLFFSVLGLIAVFVLVLLFSRVALKPVEESYAKQKRFITDASHELKTPLTIISANNEITEMTTGETKATKAIGKQVEKMSVMIKNLTTLASMTEDEKIMGMKQLDLSDLASEIAEYFRPAIQSKNRTFEVNCEKGVIVPGNEKLLRQALSTLLENASKYASSKVILTLNTVGKNAVLTVENDAENIPDGNLDRVFERFYRSDEVRSGMIAGNGIGLSIAKSIITYHGGKIEAKGANGNFIVCCTIPRK